jgi:hypothetical protein
MEELLKLAKEMLEAREPRVVRITVDGVEYKLICQVEEISDRIQLIIKER